MSNRGTALIDGRYAEFQAAVLQQLPRDIHPDTLKHWIDDRESLKRVLESALVPVLVGLPNIDWTRVYHTLGMKFEPNDLAVPADPNFWDVYVLVGVTPNKIVAAFRQLGVDVYTYMSDLDSGVPTNDRDTKKGAYRVRFQKTIEADTELANKSADDLATEKIAGITLLERLLLEFGYFLATGEHLDVENVTLCSGSRHSDGLVPSVYWLAGYRRLYVYRFLSQDRLGPLRARAVVS
jgi:hypothetical protein